MTNFLNVDPLSTLSEAMVEASGAVSSDTAQAQLFLQIYSPELAAIMVPQLNAMRLRMTPGVLDKLEKLGNSLSMRELLQRVTMNIGK
jgi:hypothetical protein